MSERPEIKVAHTADLDAATLHAARALLDEAFGESMTDQDWDHALGGVHALAFDGGQLVGHGSVVQRRLIHRGRALRTGYVEAVAVRPDRRRRGVGGAVMEPLERIIRAAYDLGALGASDAGAALYRARRWTQWPGETWALTPSGVVRTADEDGDIYVMQAAVELDLEERLTCDWRDGDLW